MDNGQRHAELQACTARQKTKQASRPAGEAAAAGQLGAVERQCTSGKCTCSYIASTCKSWNRTHGGDLAVCDSYRQSCLQGGRWDDRNRHIEMAVKR
ncbi:MULTISPECIES: hypothetical protein [unclassified Bradyrhizobium]|uniref:hypothetical protein n=1 Tax=unclassified Bradyrhizobium TaxID=2631580 RepID=UPI000413FDFB|nr:MULTISPECIES: hypothetical protein [unclassified Bradyrhizobium]QIG92940.1 hypothetical protein G6P99_10790 [Bradyrhizobium sp. 6(2017)]